MLCKRSSELIRHRLHFFMNALFDNDYFKFNLNEILMGRGYNFSTVTLGGYNGENPKT